MDIGKRREYSQQYRKKNYKTTCVDLKPETREKLDEIIKKRKISISKFISDYIEEEYKKIK